MPQVKSKAIALPEMYTGIAFSPQVALGDNISATETVIPVTDISAFPEAPSYATIGTDEGGETILYAAKTDTALSGCTRGIEGTAKAWQAGTTIARNFTNADLLALQRNIREHGHGAESITCKDTTLDLALAEIERKIEEGVVTDRSIPAVPTQFGSLTYNGQVQQPVWNGFDPSAMLISGVQEATNAGEYKVLITPKQGYYWAFDGSNNTQEVTWTIQRQMVEGITQTNNLTYNGEEQTPTWDGIQADIMTVGGDQSGVNAGEYVLSVILDNNYQWPDGSVGTMDIPWEIARAGIAAVPSYAGSLTYTGEAQAPAWSGYVSSQMSMTGDANGTNAGNYSTTFTPDSNHRWPDGTTASKTIAWAIAKAAGSLTLTVSSLELRASAMSGIIGVTRAGDGIISATSSNTGVATVSVSGDSVVVTAKAKGNATITVSVAEGTNHTASVNKTVSVVVALPTSVLNDNSWETIQDVAAAGNAANYWSVGDAKDVVINGKVGNFTFSSLTVKAFILGFDHNSAREGTNKIHFMLGKLGAADIALCDSQFGNEQTSAGYFHMNTSRTNSGGWDGCAMNKTLLNGASNSLLKALPSALQSVIQAVTKYTDNTGGGSNTASYVTGKPCKLFLPAEFEVFGARSYANSAEQNYQKQYDYFKAGNSRIANRHTAVTTAVWWWLRSPCYSYSHNFCNVATDGGAGNGDASWSAGVRACFCVSAAA